jgi:hypothetical protein
VLQKATSLADGGSWALLYIPFEKELGFLVYYAGSSRALFGREGVSLSGAPSVSLDRGEAHVEGASCLSFGHAPLYSGDYLLAQIFGIGSHSSMIAYGSTFMLTAVGVLNRGRAAGLEARPALDTGATEFAHSPNFREAQNSGIQLPNFL